MTIINVPKDYPTIKDALKAANEGDTIKLAAGVYEMEPMDISKVTIEGDGDSVIKGRL